MRLQVSAEVGTWLTRRSSRAGDWGAAELVAAKRGTRVSVVLPARDEEATVGAIIGTIRRELVERHPLVDEILVVDSHSTDATAEVARAAGADVVAQDAVFPELNGLPGKGEALWNGTRRRRPRHRTRRAPAAQHVLAGTRGLRPAARR
jgi:glucosyl-3-phosphoglycerate synthase